MCVSVYLVQCIIKCLMDALAICTCHIYMIISTQTRVHVVRNACVHCIIHLGMVSRELFSAMFWRHWHSTRRATALNKECDRDYDRDCNVLFIMIMSDSFADGLF